MSTCWPHIGHLKVGTLANKKKKWTLPFRCGCMYCPPNILFSKLVLLLQPRTELHTLYKVEIFHLSIDGIDILAFPGLISLFPWAIKRQIFMYNQWHFTEKPILYLPRLVLPHFSLTSHHRGPKLSMPPTFIDFMCYLPIL